jgi:hypothetical protein
MIKKIESLMSPSVDIFADGFFILRLSFFKRVIPISGGFFEV